MHGEKEKVVIRHPTLKGNSVPSFFVSGQEFLSCHHFQITDGRCGTKEHDNSGRSE